MFKGAGILAIRCRRQLVKIILQVTKKNLPLELVVKKRSVKLLYMHLVFGSFALYFGYESSQTFHQYDFNALEDLTVVNKISIKSK